MAKPSVYRFEADVYVSATHGPVCFVSVPPDLSTEIGVRYRARAAGFGSLRVEATVGPTTWQTSLFPAAEDEYVLPLKKAVRKAAGGLEPGDRAAVSMRVIA
jgi:hypothetical protein